ncbi:MAG: heme lyase CcmF/NrfE family subunit [Alicyclobacillus sp.]|nr:heme lyase CcmF/NrfE family subunit [Alicyclobacillus sp.]
MVMGILGQAALRGLWAVACVAVFVHIAAIRTGRSGWRRVSRAAMALLLMCSAIASAALIGLLLTENDTYAYVAEYTGPGLPWVYRIAAFWGGNAGSLLLWALVLTLYGTVVAYTQHIDSSRMQPRVSVVLTALVLFYATLLNTQANPFLRLPTPMPPSGLNPLLQNPGMTVHPVNVYLGYVGFAVPFAYAVAALWLGRTDAVWLQVTRRWTLISWLFLSIGILYGAHWSYEELGWGGYWAWDPVENAALLPWLTATAFLHSAIVQEKRGLLKAWNMILIAVTFDLTLLGTFLTRSGVLWSIHAFANGPLGVAFLTLLGISTVLAAILIIWRWPQLRTHRSLDALASKESAFLLNNVLFLACAFAVLWGTVFPLVSEAVGGRKLMVGAPFYNTVTLPLAVTILALMGIGPLLAWRRARGRAVWTAVAGPLWLSAVLATGGTVVMQHAYPHRSMLAALALWAALFAALSVFREFAHAVRARTQLTGDPLGRSLLRLLTLHRRRFGGYMVHLGVAVMAVGIVGSGAYHEDVQVQLRPGQTAALGPYSVSFAGMGVRNDSQGRELYANLVVARQGRNLGVLQPGAEFYQNGQQPTTQVALYSRPLQDLYAVLLGTAPNQGDAAVFDLHVNPLVQWIWWGGYLFILGTLVSLWPERVRAVRAPLSTAWNSQRTELYRQWAELEYDWRAGKVTDSDYRAARAALVNTLAAAEADEQALRARLEQELLSDLTLSAPASSPVLSGQRKEC